MTLKRRSKWLTIFAATVAVASLGLVATPASATSYSFNNTHPSISYSAGWTFTSGQVGYSFGDAHYTDSPGRTATFSFTGTSVTLIGGKNPLHGRADVKICDGNGANCSGTTVVDSYAASTQYQQVLFTATGLGAGAHQLVLTTRSDSSGAGTFTDIDLLVADDGLSAITGTRYVDNRAGSNCSNAGSGTSPSAPWCSFAPVNDRALGAGAQLLLARGATFPGPLRLTGTGTSSNWITLGAYGSGALPKITGSGLATDRTVIVQNPDYWNIQDLELTNAGMGLLIPYTTQGHQGLNIRRLWAHDLTGLFNQRGDVADYPDTQNSSAITITAAGAPLTSSGQTVVSDISIRDNRTENNSSVYLMADPGFSGTPPYATSTFKRVEIIGNDFQQAAAPMIAVEAASEVIFSGNRVDCRGHVFEPQGTTCFFISQVDGATVHNNLLYNMPSNSAKDETAIDLEFGVNNISIRGNLFANNSGAGVEMLQLGGRSNDRSTNTLIEQNAFYNNGGTSTGQKGHIAIYNDPGTVPPQATIRNNSYQVSPNGFISNVNSSPDLSNVTQSSNLSASSIYPSAWHFSGTQGQNGWRQQSYSGSGSWTDMPSFGASPARWSAGGGSYVDAFTLAPGVGSSQWVARTWIAPSSGTVVITGRAFVNSAAAPSTDILIERNGASVWPAGGGYQTISAGDRSGVNTSVTLTVSAGDVIRFVVYANGASGAVVGWTPSISYQ
jgi:hypothetical protein